MFPTTNNARCFAYRHNRNRRSHESRKTRIPDQVRGYAIFGMILVNILGIFDVMPWILKHHHEGFSYADHIAPCFFLSWDGYHMSFERTVGLEGLSAARRARCVAVIIASLGLFYGGFDLQVSIWDALMDIGFPVCSPCPSCTVLLQCGSPSALAFGTYQALFSFTGYGAWVMENSINGGPLGL